MLIPPILYGNTDTVIEALRLHSMWGSGGSSCAHNVTLILSKYDIQIVGYKATMSSGSLYMYIWVQYNTGVLASLQLKTCVEI
jgi:hypothetical protein